MTQTATRASDRAEIILTLRETGSRVRAAKRLGITRQTLMVRCLQFKIDPDVEIARGVLERRAG